LELIQEAATQVLSANGTAESQETFCTLMHQHLPIITDDQNPAGDGNLLQALKPLYGHWRQRGPKPMAIEQDLS